jgi:chromosomal replication initiator protein
MTETLSPQTAWIACLQIIRGRVSPLTFKTWFEPIVPLQLDEHQLTIQVPDEFFYEWLEEHYYGVIQECLASVLGAEAELVYRSIPHEDQPPQLPAQAQQSIVPLSNGHSNGNGHAGSNDMHVAAVTNGKSNGTMTRESSTLNPRYTFEMFVKGESNQLACAACVAVANNPGQTSFNPLVLYGGVGLGKTHLVQAVGNSILRHYPGKKVVYTSSDRFTIEFVEAIQKDRMHDFTNYYRGVDCLIVDDIQFFSGKEKTQDNFFHTFNALHQAGKQIILTCDRPPKELKGVDDRLISRFQCGLTTDIQPPDYETRIAILQLKCAQENVDVPADVIEFLARNITSNIRELEGCLISLLAHTSLVGKEISVELAHTVLQNVAMVQQTQLSIQDIQRVVADHFRIAEDLLSAKTRKQEIAYARQIAMYLSKELTSNSLKTIGMHFGGRDHSTVIHACQTVGKMITGDDHTHRIVESLRRQLNFLNQ